jgi:hypothetical protein
LGGVVATLALLAGFAAREPSRPQLARVTAPARGPLIEAAEHPEWKQFLVQAAYRRANELERLRDLPATPMIVEEPMPAAAPTEDKVSTLSPVAVEHDDEEITGAIQDTPGGALPVEIGEASSTELPLSEHQLIPPMQRPESLKRQNETQQKTRVKPRAKSQAKPPAKPAAEPDLLTRIFGSPPAR